MYNIHKRLIQNIQEVLDMKIGQDFWDILYK